MAEPVDNFLIAESLIVERLQTATEGFRGIFAAPDLEGVEEASQVKPAAHVLFGGFDPTDVAPHGFRAQMQQTWNVVVVAANRRRLRQAENTGTSEVGALILEVLDALMGWTPAPGTLTALTPAPSQYQTTYRPGAVYVPLAFTTRLTVHRSDK